LHKGWTIEHFISSAVVRHLGRAPFAVMGPPFEPVLRGVAVLIVFWLILYWMYRKKVFLRI
jgi:heparan-alpha-glucosaminide N-acetyltransferase